MKAWLADLPSTNARIAMTLGLCFGTAVKYWISGAPPDNAWLTFLAVMAGVDVVQFGAKRATHKESPPHGPDVEDVAAKEPPANKPDD